MSLDQETKAEEINLSEGYENHEEMSFEQATDDVERIVPAIEFNDVYLAFDDKIILNGVSFTVRQGETKIVLGGSGGGKSTIIKLILGLIAPDAGSIFIDGEDITEFGEPELMEVRKKIGMVFQEGALFDSLSVYDNVAYRLHEQHLDEEKSNTKFAGCCGLSVWKMRLIKCRSNFPAECAAVSELPEP